MEYKITNRGAEIYNLSSFDLAETFDCGQCFRWETLPKPQLSPCLRSRTARSSPCT